MLKMSRLGLLFWSHPIIPTPAAVQSPCDIGCQNRKQRANPAICEAIGIAGSENWEKAETDIAQLLGLRNWRSTPCMNEKLPCPADAADEDLIMQTAR